MEMAREFSEIWTTGDPSPADRILAEDVSSSDVIYNSSGTQGRENWKQMIQGVFKVPALPTIYLFLSCNSSDTGFQCLKQPHHYMPC